MTKAIVLAKSAADNVVGQCCRSQVRSTATCRLCEGLPERSLQLAAVRVREFSRFDRTKSAHPWHAPPVTMLADDLIRLPFVSGQGGAVGALANNSVDATRVPVIKMPAAFQS